jgi:hypothetical protein
MSNVSTKPDSVGTRRPSFLGGFVWKAGSGLGTMPGCWNDCYIQDRPDFLCVSRGVFDASRWEAAGSYSGVWRRGDGAYERFEQLVREMAHPITHVEEVIRQAGFQQFHFAGLEDLATPLWDPGLTDRVFVIACR